MEPLAVPHVSRLVEIRSPTCAIATKRPWSNVTLLRKAVVPEFCRCHFLPSIEVSVIPSSPTAANFPAPNATEERRPHSPRERMLQWIASLDVRIVPSAPTAAKTPLPKVTPHKTAL